MKLSAWHKAQGDTVLPLNSVAPADRRYASTVFSWNREKARAWARLGAEVGGSGVDDYESKVVSALPSIVAAMRPDYALYGIDYGLGFLSRGCIRTCEFCIVPKKDGLPQVVASIDDLLNGESQRKRPFIVLLDDEFFWNVKWAIARLDEFTARGIDWCPSQGLDIRCTTPPLCDALAASPFWNVHRSRRQITFAFDLASTERRYRQGVEMLFAAGIKAWQLQSYVLVGFNSTLEQDLRRIAVIREYGIDPFVMIYRDPASGTAHRDRTLRNLARWVNRRVCKSCTFEDYGAEAARRAQPTFAEIANG